MDTLSHGLYGLIAVKALKKSKLFLGFLFGILPDIIPFGLIFIQTSILGNQRYGDGPPTNIPSYVSTIYSYTHSFVIMILVFLIVYLFRKKIYAWMLGWPLHILVDIPTHSKEFFPTSFLYPISSYTFDGVIWSNPWIFFPNWILILSLLIFLFRKEIRNKFRKIFINKSHRTLNGNS